MRVLLIDGNPVGARLAEKALHNAEVCVDVAEDGEEGISLARHGEYDAIITELQLPDMKTPTMVARLRHCGFKLPILVLTANQSVEAKVSAFDQGADDYVTKPFHAAELASRVRAMVRRARGNPNPIVSIGALTLDLGARLASVNASPLHLTNMELRILEQLLLRRGTAMSTEGLIHHLYFDGDGPGSKTISVFICRLRKKLAEATGGDTIIETVPQRGYILRQAA